MQFLFIGILTLFLMYYTWGLTKHAWKEGNKFGAAIMAIMTAAFPILFYFSGWK